MLLFRDGQREPKHALCDRGPRHPRALAPRVGAAAVVARRGGRGYSTYRRWCLAVLHVGVRLVPASILHLSRVSQVSGIKLSQNVSRAQASVHRDARITLFHTSSTQPAGISRRRGRREATEPDVTAARHTRQNYLRGSNHITWLLLRWRVHDLLKVPITNAPGCWQGMPGRISK